MTQKSLLHAVAAQIANGYETAEVPMYSEHLRMPDRKVIIKIIENLQKVFFPAYFAGGTVSHVSAETFAEFLLGEIYTDLREQVHLAFSNTIADESELRERTNAVCDRFLCRLPQIQTILMKDVTANFDGDPAAGSKEEVIFSYPGLYAIFVYRVAHELYESGVPLIPRIMSEYAHGATGIDINPGAQIGEYFFIDHGTGIVVGETTVIGDHVKLYQGVTLGALSPRHGHAVTGKRHPTVGDNATIYWWNEGLHGVARAGTATMFPQAIGLAAMFDREMLRKCADITSTEARAKYNAASRRGDRDIYKGLTLWAPNVNIFRDPRWGRGHETYGEDPYLTSELGKEYVRGLQGDGKYLKTAACAKHFAVHSGPEAERHTFDAQVSPKDIEETYLPAFRALVKDAHVESVMGAYNLVNGEPACASPFLMGKLKEWGFDGYFTSDCWAIRDFHTTHCITATAPESASRPWPVGAVALSSWISATKASLATCCNF